MDNFSDKYNEINFRDDSDPYPIQIDKIYSIDYLTEEIILVLFQSGNKMSIMEYNIIEKKRLFIKSKIIDFEIYDVKMNKELNYVIIIKVIKI